MLDAIAGTDARDSTREMFRKKLISGELDETEIELDVTDTSNPMSMFDIPGHRISDGYDEYRDIFGKAMGGRKPDEE